jgi:conjugative relaxase-like TrwC/TraI family protein
LLNIGRMGPGRADYYLTAVARGGDGVEGYYLARGEEPGRWLGTGAEQLGLAGEVTAEQLRAVLDAHHPATGNQLASHPARKVPGFDHTLRAPKSVSLLWALSDRDTAEQVVLAHDAAVEAAIGYLQRAAGFTRRGAGGAETVEVDGFVAAAFRHRTSRANDPLLHTHVLVANLARTSDDHVWRTLDSRRLFAHAKTAGVLYQAQLRHELTRRLGVAWQPVVNGAADIDGVDRQLIDTFSQRRTAIVNHMAARGETSAAAAQTATLATRQAKSGHPSEAELREGWVRRAVAAGVTPGWHRQLLGRAVWGRPDLAQLWNELVVEEGLTESSSTFGRREVLQQLAGRLPAGAPVDWVEQAADAILTHDTDLLATLGPTRGQLSAVDVIRRDDGRIVAADADEARYTTRGLLLTEHRAINQAIARHADRLAVADQPALHRAVGRRNLTGEQQTMVARLTGSGAGVEVVIGKAGTGKTYALDAARDAWEASGVRVTGVALAARAALELEASAGIASTTLARLLHQLDDHRHGSPLPPGSVLVVDEAGMIGTRQLARLLDHTHTQQVKVVLVGDPRQLPEIDAGGLFRALTTRLPAIELTDNRRQHHSWEQAALDELRHGDPDTALATYQAHGRIRTAETAEQLRDRLVDDWWTTASTDLPGSIMIGLRHTDVDELNHRARTRMSAAGRLTGPTLTTGGGVELQAGERILCLRNNRTLGVVNGTRATIIHIHPAARTVEAVDDRGRPLALPGGYLDAGQVTHGYAITGHKAQGLTVDHTYTLGTETLYREWGYVAMSRGRLTNQLYHGPGAVDDEALHHHTHIEDRDDVASLTSRLRRTRAETPISPQLADLAAAWQQLTAQLDTIDLPRQQTLLNQRDRLDRDRRMLGDRVERLHRQLQHETAGFPWPKRRRLVQDLHTEHDRTATRLEDVTRQLATIDAVMAHQGLPDRQELGAMFQRREHLDTELGRAATTRIHSYRTHPPGHLTDLLGPRPPDTRAGERWDHTATRIEHHRLRYHLTGSDDPLGERTPDPRTKQHAADLRDEIRRTVHELRHHGASRHGNAARR